MEIKLFHPDALEVLREKLFLPLLNGDSQKVDKIMSALIPASLADLNTTFDGAVLQPLIDEINNHKEREAAFVEYCKAFTPNAPLSNHQHSLIDCLTAWTLQKVKFCCDTGIRGSYKELLEILWPHDVKGRQKVRIGGDRDGGYVFLDPGRDGIAYSFGVSAYSPWDLEMAKRGFKVYQFDGTIKNAPDKHPNLQFIPKNVVAKTNPEPHEKNITQIFDGLGHQYRSDIILQIDIEGGEWDFFEMIEDDQTTKFSQIIAEFHGLLNPASLLRAKTIFEKILRTHIPVHFHYNNCTIPLVFRDFIVSSLFEVTFVSRAGIEAAKSVESFPTQLDRRNVHRNPEIYIGRFQDFCVES